MTGRLKHGATDLGEGASSSSVYLLQKKLRRNQLLRHEIAGLAANSAFSSWMTARDQQDGCLMLQAIGYVAYRTIHGLGSVLKSCLDARGYGL